MSSLVLGIDLGTTYFKFGLFDPTGTLRGLGRVATSAQVDTAGRCEMSADDFWKHLERGLAEALAQAEARVEEIVAVSYATQANTFLLLDADLKPLTPILFWPDRRAMEAGSDIERLGELPGFASTSGVGGNLSPLLAAAKIKWFQRHEAKLWERTRHVMTISDYLTWGLTGQLVGDSGSAALLCLLDARHGTWWPTALEVCELPTERMSRLLAPETLVGPVVGKAAAALGLSPAASFSVGSMDHHVAAMGAGVGPLGDCSESTGTVVACAAPVSAYVPAKNVCLAPGLGAGYYAMTFDDNGAAALDWYRRTYTPQMSFEELVQLAAEVPPGAEGLQALPCPHHCPGLEGFTGRRSEQGPGHYVRAILESVTESLAGCVAALPSDQPIRRILATGGGAKSDLWLQIKADRLGTTFVRPNCLEPACRGAAMIAAAATGWFERPAEACAQWTQIERTVHPFGQEKTRETRNE